MHKIKLIRSGFFPLGKINVFIEGAKYVLKGNQATYIELPSGEYSTDIYYDYFDASRKIVLNDQSQVHQIRFFLPDWLITTSLMALIIVSVLTGFTSLNAICLIVAVLQNVLPSLFCFLFKRKTAFVVKVR